MVGLFVESAQWIAQFEGPKEIGHLLEMRPNGPNLYEGFCSDLLFGFGLNLMDHVLHANNVPFAQIAFHNVVVGQRLALAILLHISSFVDQLANDLLTWISPGNVRVGDAQHL